LANIEATSNTSSGEAEASLLCPGSKYQAQLLPSKCARLLGGGTLLQDGCFVAETVTFGEMPLACQQEQDNACGLLHVSAGRKKLPFLQTIEAVKVRRFGGGRGSEAELGAGPAVEDLLPGKFLA
jgi:hypothetical protein